MKKILRIFVGYFTAFPFVLLMSITSNFTGKEKAARLWGPIVSYIVTTAAEFLLIPKISAPGQFDRFIKKIVKNKERLKLLYDVTIVHQDADKIVFHYSNCPHCEAFKAMGYPEVNRYICDGDWDIARRHSALWDFNRTRQIGTGDFYCNHTYMRKGKNL